MLSALTKKSKFSSKSRAGHKKTKSNSMKPNGMSGGAPFSWGEGEKPLRSTSIIKANMGPKKDKYYNSRTVNNVFANNSDSDAWYKFYSDYSGIVGDNQTWTNNKGVTRGKKYLPDGKPNPEFANLLKKRLKSYVDNQNLRSRLNSVNVIKRLKTRMNNNVSKTVADLEYKGKFAGKNGVVSTNNNRALRNNAIEKLHDLDMRQLAYVRENPDEFMDALRRARNANANANARDRELKMKDLPELPEVNEAEIRANMQGKREYQIKQEIQRQKNERAKAIKKQKPRSRKAFRSFKVEKKDAKAIGQIADNNERRGIVGDFVNSHIEKQTNKKQNHNRWIRSPSNNSKWSPSKNVDGELQELRKEGNRRAIAHKGGPFAASRIGRVKEEDIPTFMVDMEPTNIPNNSTFIINKNSSADMPSNIISNTPNIISNTPN